MSSFLFALLLAALLLMTGVGALAALRAPRLGSGVRTVCAGITGVLLAAMAAGVADAVWVLGQGPVQIAALSGPSLFAFSFALDRLSGFFLLLICGVGLAVLLFARASIEKQYQGRRLALFWTLFPAFLLAMIVVVAAANAFTFLTGWELMSLSSGALILLEGNGCRRRHTAMLYLIVMHAGAAAVTAAFFFFLPYAPDLSFQAMQASHANLPAGVGAAILLLALAGFGTKTGIVPLHGALPGADASAPLPVAALMSAVLVNTAVYGLIRVLFGLLGGGPVWSGMLLLVGGAISAVLGALLSMAEHDVRRLLAYSGIENMGVIVMALGAALIFQQEHAMGWACLALAAALYHTLHHSVAKGLVFLGAGSVHQAVGSPILDDWGGLLQRMPRIGTAMLVGCAALAGFPLFGGFVGEWLLFRSLIGGSDLASPWLRASLPLLGGALALAGGVAAALCANLYGMAFLGRPRTSAAASAVPASPGEGSSLLALAAIGVAIGIFPWLVFKPVLLVVHDLVPGAVVPPFIGTVEHALPWLALILLIVGVAALLYRRQSRQVKMAATAWGCGAPQLSPRMEYSATAFSKPIRSVFHPVYRPDREVTVTPAMASPAGRYFHVAVSYRSVPTASSERYLYRPAASLVVACARQFRRLQSGDMQQYLLYIFLTLMGLLISMRWLA